MYSFTDLSEEIAQESRRRQISSVLVVPTKTKKVRENIVMNKYFLFKAVNSPSQSVVELINDKMTRLSSQSHENYDYFSITSQQ
jgi:UDP-N-acetylmuramyl pentapeptide synthase